MDNDNYEDEHIPIEECFRYEQYKEEWSKYSSPGNAPLSKEHDYGNTSHVSEDISHTFEERHENLTGLEPKPSGESSGRGADVSGCCSWQLLVMIAVPLLSLAMMLNGWWNSLFIILFVGSAIVTIIRTIFGKQKIDFLTGMSLFYTICTIASVGIVLISLFSGDINIGKLILGIIALAIDVIVCGFIPAAITGGICVAISHTREDQPSEEDKNWWISIVGVIVMIIVCMICAYQETKDESSSSRSVQSTRTDVTQDQYDDEESSDSSEDYDEEYENESSVSDSLLDSSSDTLEENYVQDTWLTELECIQNEDVEIGNEYSGETNTGVTYSHYLSPSRVYSDVVYRLNGDYDTLTALWAISSDHKNSDEKNSFAIYTDGQLAYTSPSITKGDLPVDVSVEIKGCNILTIRFKDGEGNAELGDILLSNDEQRTRNEPNNDVIKLPKWLTSMDYLTCDHILILNDIRNRTNTGESFSHYLMASGSGDNEIQYYLKGEYKKITGLWTLDQYSKNTGENYNCEIYADDVLVYSAPTITAGSLPVEFEADINNCQRLRIVFHDGEYHSHDSCLGNLMVYP